MLRDYNRSLKKSKDPLTHRYDVVEFYVHTNAKELENNLKLQGFPSDLKDKVKEAVPDYWDVFCEDVFCRPIQGFSSQIDTGKHPTICRKSPR